MLHSRHCQLDSIHTWRLTREVDIPLALVGATEDVVWGANLLTSNRSLDALARDGSGPVTPITT